jgi:hypothetical protein
MDTLAEAWTVSHGERGDSRVSEDGINSAALSMISVGLTERARFDYESCRWRNLREQSLSSLCKELPRQWLDTRTVLIRVVREVPSRRGELGPEHRG